jgi:predicted component of viral defense system (DUF524 family)
MTNTLKLKRVVLSAKFVFQILLSNRKIFIYNELPDNCKLEKTFYDINTDQIVFFISNDSFEEVGEGAIVPEFNGEVLIKELQ